ncbi:hypothetical protein Vi05172_g2183 [Venturia inaequalis]|nr:hypothetical protein Vi05172_g2183 [Venturia inaequalis]
MALCLFGSDSDSEDESYPTEDECQRFNDYFYSSLDEQ